MMLSRAALRNRHKNSGRQHDGKRFSAHLGWLRKRPCLIEQKTGHVCEGRIEAAHVDHAGGKGVSLKVADFWCVPLCSSAHAELHRGRVTFEAKYGADLLRSAEAFAKASPHRHLWEAPRG